MTCQSELILSMYADGGLTAEGAATVDAHLATCEICRARLAALRAEVSVVSAALANLPEPGTVPAFERPASYGVIAASAAILLIATGLMSSTPALLGFEVPAALAWLNPLDSRRLIDVAIRIAMFLAQHGGAIMTSIIETVTAVVITGFVAWAVFGLRKRFMGPMLLTWLVGGMFMLPAPSQALAIRHVPDGAVLVAADETIADTLIAVGETVEIDGVVEGDLIAVGRRVAIRGRVAGQVFTAATTVTLDGEVQGSVLGIGETVDASSSRIGRNLYGFGQTVRASERTSIEQNAIMFAQRAHFAGPVGRDVLGVAEEIEVANTVGGNVTAYGKRATVLAPARVAGNLTAHVPEESSLTISPSAVIGGEIVIEILDEDHRKKEYTTGEFWMFQVLRFAAAFVAGIIVLALVPGLRRTSLDDARGALIAAGLGLVALVAVPIIAVLVAITIVGIPVALLGVMLWLAGLYLAKVVLAHFIGVRLLALTGQTRPFAAALAAGLLVVILVINLPFIGGLVNFALTITGLGLLVLFVWQSTRRERARD